VSHRIAAWLASRAPRERALLAAALGVTAMVVAGLGVLAVWDDLVTLRTRVAAHERELREVRRLAARLRAGGGATTATPAVPLVARLETAAAELVGRERIAGMTPASTALDDGAVEERVALRLAGASLADTVRLLHALESAAPPLHVARLELRKRPDDRTRYEALVEVSEVRVVP
jgi:hypothetical protein